MDHHDSTAPLSGGIITPDDQLNRRSSTTAEASFPALDNPRSQTRVLRLAPGSPSDPLTGSLASMMATAPECSYEALSYEWGQPPTRNIPFILDNGRVIHITVNLAAALRDLRPEDGSAGPRLLWADGICINQDDVEERQQQVAIMSMMYRKAARVITYMGPESNGSTMAITFMELFCDMAATNSLRPEPDEMQVEAVRKVLSRGWPTRCWCAQEFTLNEKLILMCGRRTVAHWGVLASFVAHIFGGELSADLLPQSDDGKHTLPECIHQLGLIRSATSRNWHMIQYKSHVFRRVLSSGAHPPAAVQQSASRNLLYLLCQFHPFVASNRLDKVYSLMSIAEDIRVPVDYSRSVRSVYVDVAQRILSRSEDLTILHHNFPRKQVDLPSWVPDWSTWMYGIEGTVFCGGYRPSGSAKARVQIHPEDGKISLVGRLIGKINVLGTPIGMQYWRDGDPAVRSKWLEEEMQMVRTHLEGGDLTIPVTACLTGIKSHQSTLPTWSQASTAHMMQPDDNDDGEYPAESFVTRVRRKSRYSRLALTSDKHVAAVPEVAAVGDWIVMLNGGKHLYVLRETNSAGEFVYVGIAYVWGLMQGELVAPDSGRKETMFTLV